MQTECVGSSLINGAATGRLLFSQVALSFWGGVDAKTGRVIDHHHPLCGQSVSGRVLAIPSGRGSCTGSGVLFELLLNGSAPAALVFKHHELILPLAVLVARTIYDVSIPVVVLPPDAFNSLQGSEIVVVAGNIVRATEESISTPSPKLLGQSISTNVRLSEKDEKMLRGDYGAAAQMAVEIVVRFAQMQGAESLLDIVQAHVDACVYVGPASLSFAQKLVSLDAKFAVPTTLNSISLDYRRWQELGVAEKAARPALDLAQAYMAMGAQMSFTCAPYLLESVPTVGQTIGWGESNAVVFANSVLGARTQKLPDLLDVCIALIGRTPFAGCYMDSNRQPRLVITLPVMQDPDDTMYPVVGYCVGQLAGPDIPLICGLDHAHPSIADLKAFGAAFATTSSAPMFHIKGVTPESVTAETHVTNLPHIALTVHELASCHRQLNTAPDSSVSLVSLGNPHFATAEFTDLVRFCINRQKHPNVKVVVTTNRKVQEQAHEVGYLDTLRDFGVEIITDTCWCMIEEPIIPSNACNLMTNSAKYAHYAPGMVQRGVHFGSLAQCVDAACTGTFEYSTPSWLKEIP